MGGLFRPCFVKRPEKLGSCVSFHPPVALFISTP
jgi:hypothetical protein